MRKVRRRGCGHELDKTASMSALLAVLAGPPRPMFLMPHPPLVQMRMMTRSVMPRVPLTPRGTARMGRRRAVNGIARAQVQEGEPKGMEGQGRRLRGCVLYWPVEC